MKYFIFAATLALFAMGCATAQSTHENCSGNAGKSGEHCEKSSIEASHGAFSRAGL